MAQSFKETMHGNNIGDRMEAKNINKINLRAEVYYLQVH